MLIKEYGNYGFSTGGTQAGGAIRVGHIADGAASSTSNSYSGISFTGITFQDSLLDNSGGGGAIGFVSTSGTISSTIDKCIFWEIKLGQLPPQDTWYTGGAIGFGAIVCTIRNSLYETKRRHGAAISGNIDGGQTLNIYNCTFADNISRWNDPGEFRSAALYVENTLNSAGTLIWKIISFMVQQVMVLPLRKT